MWRLRMGNGSAMGPLVGMIPSKIWASEAFSLLWDLERYSREGHILTGLRTTGGSHGAGQEFRQRSQLLPL
jgi:hypothetical protein